MLSFLMAVLQRIKYNLSQNGINTSAVCKRIFFIQRKAEQSLLCSDVVRVAGLEPASVYVKIVDTSTFLRNADLHLTCIFIFISKLAPYLARISAKIFGAEKSKSGADIRSRFCSQLQKLVEFINIA